MEDFVQKWRSRFSAIAADDWVYLDSASTTQMSQSTINAMTQLAQAGMGNPKRGMHPFSENAEALMTQCRKLIAQTLNTEPQQIAFTFGTTHAINMVAHSLIHSLSAEDTIIVSQLEHHANLLPWQALSRHTGASLKVVPIDNKGQFDLEKFTELLDDSCALVAVTHMSNVTGVTLPIAQIAKLSKAAGAKLLVDGAQSIAHMPIDLSALGCDYFVFSAHKRYGPTGIGALYLKAPDSITPSMLGGGIVNRVSEHDYVLVSDVTRFEAGTANILGLVGMLDAFSMLATIDWQQYEDHNRSLINYFIEQVDTDIFQICSHPDSHSIVALSSPRFHSHDIATVLADSQIAARAGHHCAQPLLKALGLNHCVRLSLGIYNNQIDILRALKALERVPQILG